jgi:hypothetical protein
MATSQLIVIMEDAIEGEDFYREGGFFVFTRQYHLKRGHCCGSGCRHCPYDPRWREGATAIAHEEQAVTKLEKTNPVGEDGL